jgi:hypothetical protein
VEGTTAEVFPRGLSLSHSLERAKLDVLQRIVPVMGAAAQVQLMESAVSLLTEQRPDKKASAGRSARPLTVVAVLTLSAFRSVRA